MVDIENALTVINIIATQIDLECDLNNELKECYPIIKDALEKRITVKIIPRKCEGCSKDCVGCNDYTDRCPSCNESLSSDVDYKYPYCPECGQKLLWKY